MNLIYLLSILFLFSCGQPQNSKEIYFHRDTVQVDSFTNSFKENQLCNDFLKNYYSRFGIIIQNYFEVDNSLILDINRDGLMDTLAILTPVSLENHHYYDCLIENVSNRLIVEIINDNGKSRIRNIYPNLVSNIGGVLSKYNGIFISEKGFEIHHQSGSRFSWEYITEYSTQLEDSISLIKITKRCSFESKEKIEEYLFNNYSVNKINVSDTIQNNCNCDNIWNELQNK
ncbi:MAG: hypothetical protein M3Q58_11415 [Bacteroidota bacterium]|nr:hypothetical protein [Bacteroidota bacterium]